MIFTEASFWLATGSKTPKGRLPIFRTTEEMLQEFDYLTPEERHQVVVVNSQWVADQCEQLTPVPQGLHPPKIDRAEEMLREMTYENARKLYGEPLPDIVAVRLERELNSIIGNGYAPLYWIAHKLVKKSLDDGFLVGSRGSVGSSLVATMCAITEVNPLPPHYVCPKCQWSEFLGPGNMLRDQIYLTASVLTAYKRTWLEYPLKYSWVSTAIRCQTLISFQRKFKPPHRTPKSCLDGPRLSGGDHRYPAEKPRGFVMKYLEQIGETRRSAEINRLVSKITGVRRTTGQHPGGMMVVPADMEIYDFTPIQYPANDGSSGIITTHFDYHAIHDSLVKLDILGHDDPTMLRMLEDLTGVNVQEIPLDDPATMSLFSSLEALGVTEEQIGTPVGTLGIPEFGTPFVRQMLIETRPKTFGDLVRIGGLSHGTNVWNNNAQELIREGITDLSNVIACRDDIMVYLIQQGMKAGDAFRIMEQVRKGKGLTEADVSLMKEHGVPDWYIESCNKISYMFPKAHAVAYVTMAFRIAYFKVHYPLAYYATLFSIQAGDFDAEIVAGGSSRVRAEIAAIEAKGSEATAKERNVLTLLEIVVEAMARGVGFERVDLYRSSDRHFLIEGEKA